MIGRDTELRLVESFLGVAGTGARALLLRGEAGIGKTTVWQSALEAAAHGGYLVVTTRPTEAEARLPLVGLNDLVGELFDAGRPELPPPQQAALDVALLRASAEGGPMQPLALSLAVLELLRVASARQPLALGVDDAQWLDESSAGVMRFALRRLEREPVVVIATQRTEGSPGPPAILADLPEDRLTPVALKSLGVEAIDRLLGRSLGFHLAPTMLRRVHRMAGGNPFHAIEIGRALQARGIDRLADQVPIPESLAGLLRERLAALPPDAREAAAHAAALSQPTADLLEAALGPARARSGLAAARAASVLGVGDDPIRFAHPLLAAEAYTAVDEPERREVHRRLAAVVSEPEELARHLALAATGPDAGVAATLDTAADQAQRRGAPDAAAELSELAARLTPEPDHACARRMAAAGRYRLMAGDVGRARELLERCLAEPFARRGLARAELLFRLAGVRQLMDDFVASESLGHEALRHAGDDVPLTVEIKLLLAGVSFITERSWSSGARHAAEAMRLAKRLDDPRLVAMTIGPYASWRYATGHGFDPELERRARELEQWIQDFRTLDLPEFDLANIELLEGRTASSFARLRRLLERAERDGDYSSLPFLLGMMAAGDFLEGRGGVARARIDRAARLAQTTDQRTAHVHVLACEARLEARLGNAERARAAAREAFHLVAATNWRVGEWWMRADLALLELSRGDPASALEIVAGAVDPAEPDDSERHRLGQAVAVDALVALGRRDEARRVLDDLDAHARTRGSPRARAEVARARARLLAAAGDIDGAGAAIAEAHATHRQMGDPWENAHTLLVAGEIHRRARRRAKARAALREALEGFTFLGARLWARQAQRQLARTHAKREGEELTPTQRSVAELAANGLTNRQVADRLFMSAHTVEAHLSAIYRALGIRSRAELNEAMEKEPAAVRDSAGPARDTRTS
jgi:DNA-binding CsgD family transcriptional regulator